MNDLSLRVAALKLCAHPKRFAELRDALVPLPNRWNSASHGFVRQFAAAKSSAEQVLAVKEIFYSDQQEHVEPARFLADLLLASPLKHAVRNQLTKYDYSRTMAWPNRIRRDCTGTLRTCCWRHCSSRSAPWPQVSGGLRRQRATTTPTTSSCPPTPVCRTSLSGGRPWAARCSSSRRACPPPCSATGRTSVILRWNSRQHVATSSTCTCRTR
ncbi:thyroid adenoma-associated protein homolog isoform X2 [Drosophila rhopaloa]|uniref:Uncharacterized protein LOC108047817 n=1 Tax=Drosophila rhopaloa TaxID=1041015 RepID=A0A6P4EZT8_DRORH|nr:thyroid adenoma-associated protein homolog isoform X2 [Drosophila rhopaloa]